MTVDELLGCFSRRDVLGEAKQLLSSLLSDTAQPSKLIAEKARQAHEKAEAERSQSGLLLASVVDTLAEVLRCQEE